MLRHSRLTDLAESGLGEYQLKSFSGWTAGSNMASRYVHLSGAGHVNDVLRAEGVDVEGGGAAKHEPMLELSNCPQCDSPVGGDMVHCPRCGFILDSGLAVTRETGDDRVERKLAELEEAKQRMINEFTETMERFKRGFTAPEEDDLSDVPIDPARVKGFRSKEKRPPAQG